MVLVLLENTRVRRMHAMGEYDPELFAEVLAHFVTVAGEKLNKISEELFNFWIQVFYLNT